MHVVETGCLCRCWCWVPGAAGGARCWCCELAVHVVETGCWCWVPGAGAGAGAVSWLCTWWRQVLVLVLGAGCRCWRWRRCRCCVPGACCELAAHVVEMWCRCWVGAGRRCWCGCCELAVCTQHHTVSSLERSLSISAVGYLPSSGSVLADSCVKGCTVLFAHILLYVQCSMRNVKLSTNHCFSMFQHATHTIVVLILLGLGRVRPTGFAGFTVCAHTFARVNLRAQDHTGLIVLQIVASSTLQNQQWRWILLGLAPMTLTGFAVCAHTFVRIN